MTDMQAELTELRALLDAMQARCDAAPPPPWRYREAAYGDPANGPDHTVLEALCAEEWSVIARGDYDPWSGYGLGFAADARSDLPRLIAAVRAVLERIAVMERDGHSLRLHDHTRAAGTALIDAAYSLRTALSAALIEQGDQP